MVIEFTMHIIELCFFEKFFDKKMKVRTGWYWSSWWLVVGGWGLVVGIGG